MRRTAARRDSPVRAARRPARRARGARSSADVALDVRQQRQLARPLDRGRELALVPRAHAGQATRQDLAALRQEPAQGAVVLVVEHAEEHTSELQSLAYLVCRLLLEKKNG